MNSTEFKENMLYKEKFFDAQERINDISEQIKAREVSILM
jgi:hypothetical protein